MAPRGRKRKTRDDDNDNAHAPNEPTKNQAAEHEAEQSPDGITVEDFTIPFPDKDKDRSITCQRYAGASSKAATGTRLIFTHGAGGSLTNPATAQFCAGFAAASATAQVVCFQGTMNLKSRVKAFETVVEHEMGNDHQAVGALALGGRSMGARAAVVTAQSTGCKALVLCSYPLLGGKGGDELRDQILYDVPDGIDVLFVSGTRDGMCPIERLQEVRGMMKARSWLLRVEGADHGMSLTGKAKSGIGTLRIKSGDIAAKWLVSRDEKSVECTISWNEEDGIVDCSEWSQKKHVPSASSKQHQSDSVAASGRKRSAKVVESAKQPQKRRQQAARSCKS